MSRDNDEMQNALKDRYGPAERKPLMVKVNVSWLWRLFKKFKKRQRSKCYEK